MAKKAIAVERQPEAEAEASPHVARKSSEVLFICLGAWLIPGLGHFVQGRKIRGAILFVAIVTMFVLGLAMKGMFYSFGGPSYLETLGRLGEMCAGLAMPVAGFFGYSGGVPLFISSDYGTAFLVTAGMLNILAILDAYDIATGNKFLWMKERERHRVAETESGASS